jgi:hypothetical protein
MFCSFSCPCLIFRSRIVLPLRGRMKHQQYSAQIFQDKCHQWAIRVDNPKAPSLVRNKLRLFRALTPVSPFRRESFLIATTICGPAHHQAVFVMIEFRVVGPKRRLSFHVTTIDRVKDLIVKPRSTPARFLSWMTS